MKKATLIIIAAAALTLSFTIASVNKNTETKEVAAKAEDQGAPLGGFAMEDRD
jgi:hypothetical protein